MVVIMIKNKFLKVIFRFIAMIGLVECFLATLLGIIGWRSGWSTLQEYTDGLQIAGILVIGIGLLGIKGNWDATRSFEYQYSLSSIDQSSLNRTQQTLIDFAQSYGFMLIMVSSGFLSILIGWLL